MTKDRQDEITVEAMRWHAANGRHEVLSDTLYRGATRRLIRAGVLEPCTDRAGQRCVRLRGQTDHKKES